MSDLWRATTPDPINISEVFSQRKFTAALQSFKPGKALGPDSICSELILHAGVALKSWLYGFFLLAPTQNSQDLERSSCNRDPKANEAMGDPKIHQLISLLCVSYMILERLIYACVEPLINPLLSKEQAGF